MSAPLEAASAAELSAAPAGYTVRAMTESDIDAVFALETALFPEDAWPRHFFETELAHPEWRGYWVAESEGAVVAYAGAQYSPHLADVQTIAVDSAHEGRGLGTFLLELLATRSRAWGATELLLEVRTDNARAQELYARRGFETIHTRRGYYPDGADAFIMRRHLDAAPGAATPTDQGESA